MEGSAPAVLFVGDLDDPCVRGIADALPQGAARLHCGGDLPEAWPARALAARAVVAHRAILTNADLEALRRLRDRPGPAPRLVLCVGPHARFHQVEGAAALADVVLPEATASETVARHLDGPEGRPTSDAPRPRVTILSENYELRQVLAESCRRAGYPVIPARDWDEAPATPLAAWDVPVLEDGWAERLGEQARGRTVVALMGFADREMVAKAREAGAAACLDLPCDPADLAFVLDRLALAVASPRLIAEPAHDVPPAPALLRHPARTVATPRPDA